MLSLVLYPYVYLTCRLLFEMQGASVIEAGRVLGASGTRLFFGVALPLARPAIAAGTALAVENDRLSINRHESQHVAVPVNGKVSFTYTRRANHDIVLARRSDRNLRFAEPVRENCTTLRLYR